MFVVVVVMIFIYSNEKRRAAFRERRRRRRRWRSPVRVCVSVRLCVSHSESSHLFHLAIVAGSLAAARCDLNSTLPNLALFREGPVDSASCAGHRRRADTEIESKMDVAMGQLEGRRAADDEDDEC